MKAGAVPGGKHAREVREQEVAAKGTFECRTYHGIQALVTPDVPTKQYQRPTPASTAAEMKHTWPRVNKSMMGKTKHWPGC